MKFTKLYYAVKPFIPRPLQVRVRSIVAARQRANAAPVWPIDPASAVPPRGWTGWPERKKFALVLTHDVDTARGQDRVRLLAGIESELGFRSSYNFVPERYSVSPELRGWLAERGFEVGVHDLNHDGCLYECEETFVSRSRMINRYLREWGVRGFRSACMFHNLDWIGLLDIDYDASTFDTDPFEPQPDGMGTIFPFTVERREGPPFVELPYTLAQDFTMFILLRERTIDVWLRKLDWVAEHGGMVLVNVHPDYTDFSGRPRGEEYPAARYRELLEYCRDKHAGAYWNARPAEVAGFARNLPPGRPGVAERNPQ